VNSVAYERCETGSRASSVNAEFRHLSVTRLFGNLRVHFSNDPVIDGLDKYQDMASQVLNNEIPASQLAPRGLFFWMSKLILPRIL
jgi:hypothetical protein